VASSVYSFLKAYNVQGQQRAALTVSLFILQDIPPLVRCSDSNALGVAYHSANSGTEPLRSHLHTLFGMISLTVVPVHATS